MKLKLMKKMPIEKEPRDKEYHLLFSVSTKSWTQIKLDLHTKFKCYVKDNLLKISLTSCLIKLKHLTKGPKVTGFNAFNHLRKGSL